MARGGVVRGAGADAGGVLGERYVPDVTQGLVGPVPADEYGEAGGGKDAGAWRPVSRIALLLGVLVTETGSRL